MTYGESSLGMEFKFGLGLMDIENNKKIQKTQRERKAVLPAGKVSRKQRPISERQMEGALYSRFARCSKESSDMLEDCLSALSKLDVDDFSVKKLDHQLNRALERLQKSDYCVETTLSQLCGTLSLLAPEAYQTLGVMPPKFDYLNCDQSVLDEQIVQNGKEIWKQAIELTLMELEPDAICTKEMRSLYVSLEPHLPELYINFFHRLLISGYATLVEMDDTAKANMKETERALKEAKRNVQQQEEEAEKIRRTAAQLVDQKEAERLRLERENKELTSQIYELRRQNQLLQMLLESNEEELEEDSETAEEVAAEPEDSVSEQELYANIELPEDQTVVFLGGHRNFVKKVQQNHPNWRYISVADYRQAEIAKMASSKISCIIFYSKHISHPIYWTVTNQAKDVPILYLTCQNIERGEYIMRKEYAEKVLGLTAEDLRQSK